MSAKEMVLRSIWYGALATLPLVMARLPIKNVMARAVGCRRVPSSIDRKLEVTSCYFSRQMVRGRVLF